MPADMNGLLRLLIYLLLAGLIIWVVFWILGMLELPPNVKNIIVAIISIVILIWLLMTFVPGLSAAVITFAAAVPRLLT